MQGGALSGRIGNWTWCCSTDWPAIFRPSEWNWIDFTLIHAHGERVSYMDKHVEGGRAWDFHFALLGFHLFVANAYDYAYRDEAPAPSPREGERP